MRALDNEAHGHCVAVLGRVLLDRLGVGQGGEELPHRRSVGVDPMDTTQAAAMPAEVRGEEMRGEIEIVPVEKPCDQIADEFDAWLRHFIPLSALLVGGGGFGDDGVLDGADAFYFDPYPLTGSQELSGEQADAAGGSGGDEVAGLQCADARER